MKSVMHLYTLLFRHPEPDSALRALEFTAPSAERAVKLLQSLPIRQQCELWTDGQYVCSLKLLGGRQQWCTVTADHRVAEVVQREASAAE